MLQMSGYLLGKPVLSLRTGTPVAWITMPILNPHNLKIEGFYCKDSMSGKVLVLHQSDIRELSDLGYIVDDYDVLLDPEDLIRLQEVLRMNFDLYKMPVETVNKERVGKVSDYAVETTSMYIQKLYVSQSFWKSLTGGSLSVDRTQIVEVTPKRIIIKELIKTAPAAETTTSSMAQPAVA